MFAVGRGELHAVADREGAIGLAIERDALEAPWIVGDADPVLASNGHVVVFGVHVHDARILASREAVDVAALRVAHDIARVIIRGPCPIGAGDLLSGDEHAHVPLLCDDLSFSLSRAVDHFIEFET